MAQHTPVAQAVTDRGDVPNSGPRVLRSNPHALLDNAEIWAADGSGCQPAVGS